MSSDPEPQKHGGDEQDKPLNAPATAEHLEDAGVISPAAGVPSPAVVDMTSSIAVYEPNVREGMSPLEVGMNLPGLGDGGGVDGSPELIPSPTPPDPTTKSVLRSTDLVFLT